MNNYFKGHYRSIMTTLYDDQYKWIQKEAKNRNTSMAEVLRNLVQRELEKSKR